jgi:hypothetical protein
MVFPVAIHPGRSGTYAEQFLSPVSITIPYFMALILIRLFENTTQRFRMNIVVGMTGYRHSPVL